MTNKSILFSAFFLVFLTCSVYAFDFKCGDGVCSGAEYWYGKEDASNCYQDCFDKEFVTCNIDVVDGGVCYFRGQEYYLEAEQPEQIPGSFSEALEVNVRFGSHNVDRLVEPQKWTSLHDDVMISMDPQPQSVYKTTYAFHLTGLCKTEDCKIKTKVDLSKTEFFTFSEDVTFTANFDYSKNLDSGRCTAYITSEGYKEVVGTGGCPASYAYEKKQLAPGKYTYELRMEDKTQKYKISEGFAEFTVHECKADSDCNDDNPCTADICSGSPKICSNKRENGCILSNQCVVQGTRNENQYCSPNNELVSQKADKESCTANYECNTIICKNNKCHRTILGRIILFFKSIF